MIKAVLFDLDGTLLDIDMNYFLVQYFREMVAMARKKNITTDYLVEKIWTATRAMMDNKDFQMTNREVFEQSFFKDASHSPEVFGAFFDEFYDRGFDQLKGFTRPFPQIPPLVEKVFEQGCEVVIATNSVFPELAIRKRLDWAEVGDFDYRLITSYEVMHATKPHLEYYQEVVDSLGVRPEECLMVGNDVGEDLVAGQLGIKTFLVKDRLINDNKLEIKADWEGFIDDLAAFFNQGGWK